MLDFDDESFLDDWINDRTKELFDRRPLDKPWFLQVNYAGPHPPFSLLESMAKSVENKDYAQPIDSRFPADQMTGIHALF